MTELAHAIGEARRVRRQLVRRYKETDLGGLCAFASLLLANALGSPKSLRVTMCSYQRHVWNVVDGTIIDITATQFNDDQRADNAGFPPVFGVLVTREPRTYHQPVLAYGRTAAAVIADAFTCLSCGDPLCNRAEAIAWDLYYSQPRGS